MINVRIAKIGNPVVNLELEDGTNTLAALTAAGFSADAVLSVKRDGQKLAMDAVLVDGNMLIVTQDKIKGGNEEEDGVVENIISVGFEVEYQAATATPETTGRIAVDWAKDLFLTIRDYVKSQGQSMDDFLKVLDAEGNEVALSDTLEDETDYKIILKSN